MIVNKYFEFKILIKPCIIRNFISVSVFYYLYNEKHISLSDKLIAYAVLYFFITAYYYFLLIKLRLCFFIPMKFSICIVLKLFERAYNLTYNIHYSYQREYFIFHFIGHSVNQFSFI